MHRCDFVDPDYNFPCGKKAQQKIVVNIPNKRDPIVKFVCELHGDKRFNWLSSSEKKLNDEKDRNQIDYKEFKERIKVIRWKKCRLCGDTFDTNTVQCCLEYFYITDTRVGLKRSFLLNDDCLKSELRYYEINKDVVAKNTTLDGVLA